MNCGIIHALFKTKDFSNSIVHMNYIIEGEGALVTEDGELPFKPGDVIFVDPFMKHNYKNMGDTTLKFLCLVPLDKPAKQVKKNVNPFAAGKANNC